MAVVLVSTKGQIVLPMAVRKALGLKPGMRVDVRLDGRCARIAPATAGKPATIDEVRAALGRSSRRVAVKDMRVTDYTG